MKQTKFIRNLLTLLVLPAIAIPAQADIDWIGIQIDSQRFGEQLRRNQEAAQGGRRKKGTKRRQTAKKPAPKKVVERYPQVRVNDQILKSAVPATEIEGRTFVPFRDIFEALGATINYDQQKQLITAWRGDSRMEILLPRGNAADMKGKRQSFKGAEQPFIRNGTMMIPLRMVSEMMGDKVHYTSHPKVPQINITSREQT